jgi:anti-sigma B factor antagonist
MTERPTRPAVRAPAPDLAVDVHDVGGLPVVAVRGELDIVTVPRVRERIEPVGTPLVLDLVGVRLLSSAALQMLVDLHEDHRAGGHVLHVVVDRTRTVLRPLQITGLDGVLALHATVPDALAGRQLT